MDKEDVVRIYDGALFSRKKNEMPCAATWMQLEPTIPKSERERQIPCDITYMEFKI